MSARFRFAATLVVSVHWSCCPLAACWTSRWQCWRCSTERCLPFKGLLPLAADGPLLIVLGAPSTPVPPSCHAASCSAWQVENWHGDTAAMHTAPALLRADGAPRPLALALALTTADVGVGLTTRPA